MLTAVTSYTIVPTYPGLPTVFSLPGQHLLKRGSLLTTLPTLSQDWRISFQFNPFNFTSSGNGYTSLLHLTSGGKWGNFGDSTPSIFFQPNFGMQVVSAINENPDFKYKTNLKLSIPVSQWSTISVSQESLGGVVIFSIVVNGEEAFAIENTQPKEFKSVKVFASAPWYEAQPGLIRALTIQTNSEKPGEIRYQIRTQ